MSLDKFIGSKRPKKRVKPIKKSSSTKFNGNKNAEKVKNFNSNDEKDSQRSSFENSQKISETFDNSILNGTYSLNPQYQELRNILIEDFKHTTKDKVIDLLITQIHSSATYSSNKNMINNLLSEKDYSINEIAILLNISFVEAFILVKEILTIEINNK